ncbi:MAG: phosphoribosyltransferase family protein [Planctomycetota bacterium]|nr:phosphoribosyltransferase family protein [Planctomycetota bacterium]
MNSGSVIQKSLSHLLRLVFPQVCCNCCRELPEADWGASTQPAFCQACQAGLAPRYARRCLRCGAGINFADPISDSAAGSQTVFACPHCRRAKFAFQRCFSIGNYERRIREAVLRIKTGNHDPLAAEMSKILLAQLEGEAYDLVLPIPIHWRRRLGRPTVVSELVAERISRWLKIPYAPNVLRYSRLTRKQGMLATTERKKNLKNSIYVRKRFRIENRKLLLVDDVMTSGATLHEAATACLKTGARSVDVAVLARGIGRSMNG